MGLLSFLLRAIARSGGLGGDIAWFYAAVGIVSLVTPALAGHFADRFIPSRTLLGICHLAASTAMFGGWIYASSHPQMEFLPFFLIYLCFLSFYMPTMALANTTTFALLKHDGKMPVDHFPAIRIWGTVGFVAAMWFVNSAYLSDGSFGFTLSDTHPASRFRFQYTPMQLFASAMAGVATGLYSLTLPIVKTEKTGWKASLAEIFGLKSFRLFKVAEARIFLIFAIFAGVCLQISNGYAIPYINHFMGIEKYAGSLAAGNATLLFSLSQISEAVCILLVGVAMKRLGFRWVFFIAMAAWCVRFATLGLGNPDNGLWLFVLSMIIYGIAFNFFNIAGGIFMEKVSDNGNKGFGQGLLMMMSNGIGATCGMICAGAVVNRFCSWQPVEIAGTQETMRLFMGEWTTPWLLFATYSLIIGLLFLLFTRNSKGKQAD